MRENLSLPQDAAKVFCVWLISPLLGHYAVIFICVCLISPLLGHYAVIFICVWLISPLLGHYTFTATWLAQLIKRQSAVREARVRFPARPTLRVLK